MSKKYERRVSELVRQHLSMLIETRLKDPRVSGVSVTDVAVTSDTRHAKVYYSLIGDEKAREQAASGLESAGGWLRHELGIHLHTRHTPELVFVFDPSMEQGARVSDLLDELKEKEAARMRTAPESGNSPETEIKPNTSDSPEDGGGSEAVRGSDTGDSEQKE